MLYPLSYEGLRPYVTYQGERKAARASRPVPNRTKQCRRPAWERSRPCSEDFSSTFGANAERAPNG